MTASLLGFLAAISTAIARVGECKATLGFSGPRIPQYGPLMLSSYEPVAPFQPSITNRYELPAIAENDSSDSGPTPFA